MIECEYTPKNSKESLLIAGYNCNILLNLALCFQHTKEWNVCIQACTTILTTIDHTCVKALYRRALVSIFINIHDFTDVICNNL